MRQPGTGVVTKQRKLPPSNRMVASFSGSDAMDWLMKAKSLTEREHAAKILNKILKTSAVVIRPLVESQKGTSTIEIVDSPKSYYYFVVRKPVRCVKAFGLPFGIKGGDTK